MKSINVKFISPKVLHLNPRIEGGKMIVSILLDWNGDIALHEVYREKGKWVWTDAQAPIPVRKFDSLESLCWEYELSEDLIEILKLIK